MTGIRIIPRCSSGNIVIRGAEIRVHRNRELRLSFPDQSRSEKEKRRAGKASFVKYAIASLRGPNVKAPNSKGEGRKAQQKRGFRERLVPGSRGIPGHVKKAGFLVRGGRSHSNST